MQVALHPFLAGRVLADLTLSTLSRRQLSPNCQPGMVLRARAATSAQSMKTYFISSKDVLSHNVPTSTLHSEHPGRSDAE
jgi:hypothetical protein